MALGKLNMSEDKLQTLGYLIDEHVETWSLASSLMLRGTSSASDQTKSARSEAIRATTLAKVIIVAAQHTRQRRRSTATRWWWVLWPALEGARLGEKTTMGVPRRPLWMPTLEERRRLVVGKDETGARRGGRRGEASQKWRRGRY